MYTTDIISHKQLYFKNLSKIELLWDNLLASGLQSY